MTQFASTLYPQTNPSNPILLEFREYVEEDRVDGTPLSESIASILRVCHPTYWGYDEGPRGYIEHARRVLTRLAALSG